jgi:MoaA/NifB/PqqE/SkfB family radical SAM enzyme
MIDKDNKSFCAVPFVSTMVNTDTTIRYCCMVKGAYNKLKKPDGTFYSCKDNFISEAWNSQDMRDIRLAMIEGKRIEGCSVCYDQEANGRTSNRQHSIQEWSWRLGHEHLNQLVADAVANNGHLDSDPVYLDLRLGNLCNLKCRMCNPWNSSQIVKEHENLAKNAEYSEVWRKTFGKFPLTVMDDQQWFDHDIMWDQVISLIPTLKKVYMTGGEPTLIKNNFKFMKACIEQGRKDIVLFFNTNCTNVNKQFLELISQFDQVNINASMDGIGIVNEYIRAPSDWKQISENIEKLAQMPNVNLGVTPTIQVYNVFDIVNMLKWVDGLNLKYSKNIFIDFLVNHHPHHLSVRILDNEMRFEALKMIDNAFTGVRRLEPQTRNSLNGIIGLLQQPRVDDWEEQLQRFKTYTNALDAERDQSIADIDSRLAELCR